MDIACELLQMAQEQRKMFRQEHNYNIIRKTGNYEELLKTIKPNLITK